MKPSAAICMLLLSAALLTGGVSAQSVYVGSEACKECHWAEWSRFRGSAHGITLQASASTRGLPLPAGYDWADLSYALGGNQRKSLFLNSDGYFITGAGGQPGANQYDLETDRWSDYHPGEVNKPFDCGSCHTTGFSPSGHQDGLPGIQGTWAMDGVQCENCHGPASYHLDPPHKNISTNPWSASCGGCHSNGPTSVIPAADGFIQANAQYNELLASPHNERWCVECHDPHSKVELSIWNDCTNCHAHYSMGDRSSFKSLGRRHLDRGVECWDCHMPHAAKSTTEYSRYRGDVRSHLFKITLNSQATMFNQLGNRARSNLTAAFACLGCHDEIVRKFDAKGKPEKAEKWARKFARKIHKH